MNGTHGAGVILVGALSVAGTVGEYTMDGDASNALAVLVAELKTGDVQYTNEPSGSVVPSGWYVL